MISLAFFIQGSRGINLHCHMARLFSAVKGFHSNANSNQEWPLVLLEGCAPL